MYQPILIFEKCRKMSLLFPCKLKIPFFLVFTMYKVHYNSCHDGCKITILEYILRKNLRIALIQNVCFRPDCGRRPGVAIRSKGFAKKVSKSSRFIASKSRKKVQSSRFIASKSRKKLQSSRFIASKSCKIVTLFFRIISIYRQQKSKFRKIISIYGQQKSKIKS